MRFKSAKFYLKHSTRSAAFWLLAGVYGALIPSIPSALATVTITSANGSIANSSPGGTSLYYFVKTSAVGSGTLTGSAFQETGTPLDLSKGSEDASQTGLFKVSLTSTRTVAVSGAQVAVAYFTSDPQGTGTPHPAPIASVNGVLCSDNNGNGLCTARNLYTTHQLAGDRYYGVRYPGPGQTVEIGFYPKEVCQDEGTNRASMAGCNNGVLIEPLANTPTVMRYGFSIATYDGTAPTVFNTLESMAYPVSFVFQIDTPTFTCPTATLNDTVLRPGDTKIYMNTGPFGLVRGVTSDAPLQNFFVVGNSNSTGTAVPSTGTSFRTANALVAAVTPGVGETEVKGFTNTTSTAARNIYQISFLLQDRAGIIVPADATSCKISNVETGAIYGFLDPNNPSSQKCFIATAAFGSAESAPVVLLREFRDHILLHFSAGRGFVNWYYSWSPEGAEWLSEHPLFRIPVLFFLAPLEALAWLCLNPVYLFFLFGLVGLSGIILVYRQTRHYDV